MDSWTLDELYRVDARSKRAAKRWKRRGVKEFFEVTYQECSITQIHTRYYLKEEEAKAFKKYIESFNWDEVEITKVDADKVILQ